ncbi:RDD family protein [Bacilliculturomica massiliensis]|uniref:RDD family protein n=1 Tax=Bacilliculturomica massiliensis TaxID=1917867 RepID=UPI0013EF4868|nr:RDD family protein [Bacilliculturomica massiliensis]
MRKEEFLKELRYSLEGRLPDADIREITSDYGDVFENASAEGKSEQEVADELGSPAKIARTILEEDELKKRETAAREAEERARMAENEARAARAAEAEARAAADQARDAFRKEPAADARYGPFAGRMAPMGTRLAAYLTDGVIQIALLIFVGLVILGIPMLLSDGRYGYWGGRLTVYFQLMTLLLVAAVGCMNLLTAVFVWATNGYTPGKWLFKIRVVRLSGQKITFMEAVMREFLIKGIASGMTSGLLNLFSFIWGCSSDFNKTVQDLVADTTVVFDERRG